MFMRVRKSIFREGFLTATQNALLHERLCEMPEQRNFIGVWCLLHLSINQQDLHSSLGEPSGLFHAVQKELYKS